MKEQNVDIAEQFEKVLNNPKQMWLLGAGISFQANIPLMIPLTTRVLEVAKTIAFHKNNEILTVIKDIKDDIDTDAHIEIFLTHLTDLISMSIRARDKKVKLGNTRVTYATLIKLHNTLLQIISETIRWGYIPATDSQAEIIGSFDAPVVTNIEHLKFTRSIFFNNRAGLEKIRGTVEFYTTNYDTLIEDSLALNQIKYDDGFVGGGVGFWQGYEHDEKIEARIIKLHGSIDWVAPQNEPSQLLRTRFSDTYPVKTSLVVIHPQSAKYINAQNDPFSELFNRFRLKLADGAERVLLICGYSFGDAHINADIDLAMSKKGSELTIIAFIKEDNELPPQLEEWRKMKWGERVYIASDVGLYQGKVGPIWETKNGRNWWTFSGVTQLISDGLPIDIQEAIE